MKNNSLSYMNLIKTRTCCFSLILSFYCDFDVRNGTHRFPFPTEVWTNRMTQDLRAAYDVRNSEINVKCSGVANKEIQVILAG